MSNEKLYEIALAEYTTFGGACNTRGLRDAVDAVADAVRAEHQNKCAHNWHDYGQVNQSWCGKCNALAVTGYENRPFTALAQQEQSNEH